MKTDPSEIISRAREKGFEGFGNLCFEAAVAINRVVFNGKGKLVAGFNEALVDYRLLGHVAVLVNGECWDADGRPKSLNDIESWGMLDFEDQDYAAIAAEYGIEWTEETAYDAAIYRMSEKEVLTASGTKHLAEMIAILEEAKKESYA